MCAQKLQLLLFFDALGDNFETQRTSHDQDCCYKRFVLLIDLYIMNKGLIDF